MPTAFTDLPSQYNAIALLTYMRDTLKNNGVLFNTSVKCKDLSEQVDNAIVVLRRLRMIEDLFMMGNGTSTITCDTCDHHRNCQFAYDLYNTDGDCLASK